MALELDRVMVVSGFPFLSPLQCVFSVLFLVVWVVAAAVVGVAAIQSRLNQEKLIRLISQLTSDLQ